MKGSVLIRHLQMLEEVNPDFEVEFFVNDYYLMKSIRCRAKGVVEFTPKSKIDATGFIWGTRFHQDGTMLMNNINEDGEAN